MWGFSVMVDYWPRRLDLAALQAGALAEVLNLAPWGGVLLQLPPHRQRGAAGWGALCAALGEHWLRDITTTQVPFRRAFGKLRLRAIRSWGVQGLEQAYQYPQVSCSRRARRCRLLFCPGPNNRDLGRDDTFGPAPHVRRLLIQ